MQQTLIAELPERTQLVLNLYYVEELNLKNRSRTYNIGREGLAKYLVRLPPS